MKKVLEELREDTGMSNQEIFEMGILAFLEKHALIERVAECRRIIKGHTQDKKSLFYEEV